jgi:hypothetical protein
MSLATNSNALTNLQYERDTSQGLNLSVVQANAVPANLKNEVIVLPSTSQPAFGSYCVFDLKEKNILVHDLVLQFNTTAISGRSGDATSYPNFLPAYHWWTRIELVMNNVVIDTYYPTQQFILNQILYEDEDRVLNNALCGSYASITQRYAKSNAAGSNYYVKLQSIFNQCHLPILNEAHSVQLRVYLDTVANIVCVSGGSGTSAATINYANLIAKITRMTPEIAQTRLLTMAYTPEQNIYHNLRYATFTVASGVTSTTLVLTPIVGKVAMLFFIVRTATATVSNSALTFTAISSFEILDSSSTNCVGGQPILSDIATQYLAQYWSRSSYTSETASGANLAGTITDKGANVYIWSFSADTIDALTYGKCVGSKQFIGAEQLKINFTASLGANVQIDVFALTESILEQGSNYVKTLGM